MSELETDPYAGDDPNDPNCPGLQDTKWALEALEKSKTMPPNTDARDRVFECAYEEFTNLPSRMEVGRLTPRYLTETVGHRTARAIVEIVVENLYRVFERYLELQCRVEHHLAYWRFRYLAQQMDPEV